MNREPAASKYRHEPPGMAPMTMSAFFSAAGLSLSVHSCQAAEA